MDELNEASYGHPYLMQLLGYHLVARINESAPGTTHEATVEEVADAIRIALFAYELKALKPLLDELPASNVSYLKAMAECLDDERLASTAQIANSLGQRPQNLSRVRAGLIGDGIIAAPEHGKVMFCIPYLSSYALREQGESDAVTQARLRRV